MLIQTSKTRKRIALTRYANDVDAFIPELWANESLAILEENMVVSGLVHRDFENVIAQYGDVVNTRKPADFKAKRKDLSDNVTVQDAVATNVQVPLNQHVHTSFLIRDGEESKSFKSLIDEYMRPAMIAQARFIDQIVLGQHPQFWANFAGGLGLLSETTAKGFILDTREVLNKNKAPMSGRNLILTPDSETEVLKLDLFISAERVGDEGSALREASIGRKLGFDFFMAQNASSVAPGNSVATAAVNNGAGYPIGATAIVVDTVVGTFTAGEYVTIAGDDTPQRLAAAAALLLTLVAPGLRRAVADNAVIVGYTFGEVNLAAGYAAGWSKEIVVDGFTVAPRVGQSVSFGTNTNIYTIIDVTGLVGITLDRPLILAIVDNENVNLAPAGNYNFGFLRNALGLVVRPLAMPKAGTGALASVINHNNLSMRAVITYDGNKQGHLVTLDMLCGIAVLDVKLGAVMFG